MDEVISLRVRNRRQQCFQVARQIETPRAPDPILRRPCADREEKRVTHGRDMTCDGARSAGSFGSLTDSGVQCLLSMLGEVLEGFDGPLA